MDQALSLYLLETIPLLDPESPDYALDLVTLVESILENPEIILRRQLDKIKDRAVAQMKADRRRVRAADGGAREARVPEAAAGLRLHDVQRVRRPAPVGGRGEHPAEVDRPGDVRAVPIVRGVRARLRPAASGGAAAAAPEQRLQGPEPDGARRREERPGAGDGGLPPNHAARGGLEPGRGVGANEGPGVPAAGNGQHDARPGPAAAWSRRGRGHHPRYAGIHGGRAHAGLHLPAGVGFPRQASRLSAPASRLSAPASRLSRNSAPSTARSASTPRPATSATPTSRRPAMGRPGACSRCWWTPRTTTTGWPSSKWISPPRARNRRRWCGSSGSDRWKMTADRQQAADGASRAGNPWPSAPGRADQRDRNATGPGVVVTGETPLSRQARRLGHDRRDASVTTGETPVLLGQAQRLDRLLVRVVEHERRQGAFLAPAGDGEAARGHHEE